MHPYLLTWSCDSLTESELGRNWLDPWSREPMVFPHRIRNGTHWVKCGGEVKVWARNADDAIRKFRSLPANRRAKVSAIPC